MFLISATVNWPITEFIQEFLLDIDGYFLLNSIAGAHILRCFINDRSFWENYVTRITERQTDFSFYCGLFNNILISFSRWRMTSEWYLEYTLLFVSISVWKWGARRLHFLFNNFKNFTSRSFRIVIIILKYPQEIILMLLLDLNFCSITKKFIGTFTFLGFNLWSILVLLIYII